MILARQEAEPWGSGVIRRLSMDLRRQFPDMKGLSPTNLQYMRAFAAAWPDGPISQRSVGKLPWGHVCTLLDQVKDPELRDWYADRDVHNGWTRPVLEHHVATGLHRRVGAAPSNFTQQLDPLEADQAQEIVKDPYVFDFLGLTDRATERAIEQALTDRLQDTLAELGQGFAFVGRQHRLTVDNEDHYIDLLLFHAPTVRFIRTSASCIVEDLDRHSHGRRHCTVTRSSRYDAEDALSSGCALRARRPIDRGLIRTAVGLSTPDPRSHVRPDSGADCDGRRSP